MPTRTAPVPCVARPNAGLVHRDGPCRCFVGGPAPERVLDSRVAELAEAHAG
jgi:hypothetical protein